MKTHLSHLAAAFIILALFAPSLHADSITVANASFESPGLSPGTDTKEFPNWTKTGGDVNTTFVERIAGFSAEGNQHLGMELNAQVYQDLNVTYQANTIYVLRVAVGNRSGYTVPDNISNYALTEPGGAATVADGYSGANAAISAFVEAPALFVDTSVTTALVDKPIRIKLSAGGAGRSHFDNVRLDTGRSVITTVTNGNGTGPGSLREAIANAAAMSGPDTITFAPALSGQTIILASEIGVSDLDGVTVDATSLPGGLTISGNFLVRQFALIGGSLTLRRLTLSGGKGLGASNVLAGGAVRTLADTTLVATDCTFQSNSADKSGGAISSSGTTTIERCLFAFNGTRSDNTNSGVSSGASGAITNNGTLTVRHSTLMGNFTFSGTTTGNSAAAIYSFGAGGMTLEHVTISGNTAGGDATATKAGVIVANPGGVATAATIKYSIITGTATNPPGGTVVEVNVGVDGNITLVGANLIATTSTTSGGTLSGNAPIPTAPNLGALAANGGPTQTMLPNAGSPAINAASGSTASFDQRLFWRTTPDLGAAEAGAVSAFVVTSNADTGDGSLRWALANAAVIPGAHTITFAPGLSGQPITLGSTITINDASGVTIDASSLPAGVTISGNNNRIFQVQNGTTFTLRGLTLSGGVTGGGGVGGAIYNLGDALTLTHCTLSGNHAAGGAAIYNGGGALTLTHCTLSGNSASSSGGAIYNVGGALMLTHCTLSGNSASGDGGAIINLGTLTLTHTIAAGNSASSGPDILHFSGTITPTGVNLIGNTAGSGLTANGTTILVGAPNLSPLGNYGGPTWTMPPLPGSLAIDAASVLAQFTTDQRGFARPADGDGNGTATPDIGAVEVRRITVTTAADQFDTPTGAQTSLREAIRDGADAVGFSAAVFSGGGTAALDSTLTVGAVALDTAVSGGGNVDVAVNAGTLSFGAGSAWTGGGRILLGATSGSAAATVEVNGPDGFTLAAPITVRAGSSGVKTLRAANTSASGNTTNTYAGDITLLAPATVERVGGVAYSQGGYFTGKMDLGAHLLTVNTNDDVYFTGQVGRFDGFPGTAQVEKNGDRYLYLGGSGDNPRLAVTVNAGDLDLIKVSSASAIGSGLPAGTNALTVAAGARVDVASGDQIVDTASVTLNGTMYLYASETLDALNGSGMVELGLVSGSTLTVGAGNGIGSFSGTLKNEVLALSLTKTGAGTQTLSGDSGSFLGMSGAVLVSGGTLNVTGSLALCTGTTVQSGATLAGTGTVKNVGLASGSFFAPGDAAVAASIDTLNVTGSTTWNGGATARFHLSGVNNTSDKVASSGALSKGSAGTYTFDFQGTGTAGQIYTLATFTSSTFAASDFTHTNLAAGLNGFFTLNLTSLTFTIIDTRVTTTADSDAGSLRQAIANAASVPGADILTFPAALAGPIVLSSEIVLDSNVTLDASNLPGGVTISGGGTHRLFSVSSGQTVTLKNLTLTGGNAAGGNSGGALYNAGTTALERCTLSGNTAGTVPGQPEIGGAIYNDTGATLTLTRCTLADNHCLSNRGGAIYNRGSVLTLTYCTVAGNTAKFDGGGIRSDAGTFTMENSIAGGNTVNGSSGDIFSGLAIVLKGASVIEQLSGTTTGNGTRISAAPLLAPLGNYGGPTQTMALLPGSPARDAVNSVTNPSFEANTFGGTYTYTGTITGWTSNNASRTGLSLGGSPLADNGTIPNGTQVAFLQSLGQPITLSTTLTGLVPGQSHTVTFRVNARSGYNTPQLGWTVSDVGALTEFSDGAILPVGGMAPYRTITGNFTATAATATLAITNVAPGTDSTLLLDAVTVALTGATDQRGFPMVGTPDIGAYEAGTPGDFYANAVENGTSTNPDADADNDGNADLMEYATRGDTHVFNGNPVSEPLPVTLLGNVPATQFGFAYRPESRDLRYIVKRSGDLSTWTEIYRLDMRTLQITRASGITSVENNDPAVVTLTDPNFIAGQTFYILEVDLP